jgi:phospholipid/cholesterol/gamma-HCH transport system substrate-binding protein
METRANYVIAGSFVVGLMMAALIFVLWLSQVDFGSKAPLYDIYFEGSVSGLRVNESVRYHGIPIGKVKEIGVAPKNIDRIRVRVAITEPKLMREDTIASIEIQGLTGYTYVQIQGGKESSPLLKAQNGHLYPIIPSQPSKIDLLFSNAPHILSSIYKLSTSLNEVFNKKNREEVHTFLRNASRISAQLSEGSNSLESIIQQTRHTLDHINQSVTSMQGSFTSFAHVMEDIRLILHDNKGTVAEALDELPKTLKQVGKAADRLRRLTRDLEQNPLTLFSKSEDQGYKIP